MHSVNARIVALHIRKTCPARYKYLLWSPTETGAGFWWSRELGWLYASRQNAKHYATFKTEAAAAAQLCKLLGENQCSS